MMAACPKCASLDVYFSLEKDAYKCPECGWSGPDHDEEVDRELRASVEHKTKESKAWQENCILLESRNDYLMNMLGQVDYLLMWGKVFEARSLITSIIDEGDNNG